jgi:hypothetical protein
MRPTSILVLDEEWRKDFLDEEREIRARIQLVRQEARLRALSMQVCVMQGNRVNLSHD